MNQDRGHVDEFRGDVDIEVANLLHIRQVLRGDLCDRNIVDVNVLLANQIKQKIERAFINIVDGNGERKIAFLSFGGVFRLR
jgi:hypothetical protein